MQFAALDLRLIDSVTYRDFSPPKYEALATKVLSSPGCVHIVFVSESRRESLDYCTEALVAAGVERSRIVTMHGGVPQGRRQDLVDGLNGVYSEEADGSEVLVEPPKYDVIIGNQVMSEGLNLQRRACSIHHLDLPWTPSDVGQRNGRGVRQGNVYASATGEPVRLYYYLTERSADGYRLQTIAGKRSWINTLIKSSEGTANNPLADSEFGELDLITMFAEDPEEARELLEKKKAEAEAERLGNLKADAYKRFSTFARLHARAKAHPDPQYATRYKKQAEQIERYLRAYEDAVFARKDLLDVAKEGPVFWDGEAQVMRPKEQAVVVADGMSRRVVIEEIDAGSGSVTFRPVGKFVTESMSFDVLKPALREAGLPWDRPVDEQALVSSLERGWEWFSPRDFRRVPERLLERHGKALWKVTESQPWGARRPEHVPFVLDGQVVTASWDQAIQLRRQGHVPLFATTEDWATFVRTEGGALTARRKTARRWFGRTYPEPATEAPVAQAAKNPPACACQAA